MHLIRNFVSVTTWLALAILFAPVSEAENSAERLTIKKASVGFGGKFKAGFWQPVRLTVVAGPEGARGRLELVAPDGDQSPVVYRDELRGKIDLAANEEATVLLYAKSGPVATPFTLRLTDEAHAVSSHEISPQPALHSTQEFVVGIGPPLGLVEAAGTIRRRADGAAVAAVEIRGAEELPDRWWGYDGVDVVVLTTSDLDFLSALGEEQREAIIEWVQLGGRMVLCVGGKGEEIVKARGAWSRLVPGELVEVTPLRERSGLERFTKSELPFDDPEFQRNRPFVTRLKNVRGEVPLDEGSASAARPLVVHAPAGLGEVTFVGIDLDHPSLKGWKGRTRMVASLLSRGSVEREQSDREVHRGITHLGYEDLVGQLRAALDQFPGVSLVNFTTVSVLTLAYLLLIGPIDFLILSRLSLPRHLTWFTFPAVAVAVMALAGAMGRQAHGSRVRVNQAEIVDIDLVEKDLVEKRVRGTVWCHVYSPETRPFDMTLRIAAPEGVAGETPKRWLAWQGLPGDSLGGLESQQPSLISREPYFCDVPEGSGAIENVKIQAASSKSLAGCWWSKSDLAVAANLTIDRYGLLAGDFKQPLPVDLTECILAHGEKLYRLGSLKAGQQVRVADLAPLNLEARLTERRVEHSKDVSTPWERDSVDVPRIAQMLMFHEAARGRSYTGLTHRYQPQIDLSEHIRLGQAVLVGRAEQPATRLVGRGSNEGIADAGDTNSWTWYRIVLPVEQPEQP